MSPFKPPQPHMASSKPTEGLRATEEAWREPFERLLQRFPHAGAHCVAKALRDAGGHAGRAAAALRVAQSDDGSPAAFSPEAQQQPDAPWRSPRVKAALFSPPWSTRGAKQEDCRYTAMPRAPPSFVVPPPRLSPGLRLSPPPGSNHTQEQSDPRVPCSTAPPYSAATELVEALSHEGRQLRRQLDSALAEARAERTRADLAEQIRTTPPEIYDSVARKHFFFQEEAAIAALNCSRLVTELEESRDEGRKLKGELERALASGGCSVDVASERERHRKELEIAIAQSAAVAAAIAERDAEVREEAARARWQSFQMREELHAPAGRCGAHCSNAMPTASKGYTPPPPAKQPAEPSAASVPERANRPRHGIGKDFEPKHERGDVCDHSKRFEPLRSRTNLTRSIAENRDGRGKDWWRDWGDATSEVNHVSSDCELKRECEYHHDHSQGFAPLKSNADLPVRATERNDGRGMDWPRQWGEPISGVSHASLRTSLTQKKHMSRRPFETDDYERSNVPGIDTELVGDLGQKLAWSQLTGQRQPKFTTCGSFDNDSGASVSWNYVPWKNELLEPGLFFARTSAAKAGNHEVPSSWR